MRWRRKPPWNPLRETAICGSEAAGAQDEGLERAPEAVALATQGAQIRIST
jgi:hypothetical protein